MKKRHAKPRSRDRRQAPTHTTTPERALWCAVLLQVLDDAKNVRTYKDRDHATAGEMFRAHYTALNFLEGNSRDFYMVCDLAGIDPQAVKQAWKRGCHDFLQP